MIENDYQWYTGNLCLCPTFLYLFAAFTLISLHVIVWSMHVRGTAASSAPVPIPILPDVGICCNTLGCMIHAQLMLHCVTSSLVSVLLMPTLHLHYFCKFFLIFLFGIYACDHVTLKLERSSNYSLCKQSKLIYT